MATKRRQMIRVTGVNTIEIEHPETQANQVLFTDASNEPTTKTINNVSCANVDTAIDNLVTAIGQAGKVDDVKVDGTSVVTNKVASISLTGKVDKTTKVNGHALSGDVSVTKSDVGLGSVSNAKQIKAFSSTPTADKIVITKASDDELNVSSYSVGDIVEIAEGKTETYVIEVDSTINPLFDSDSDSISIPSSTNFKYYGKDGSPITKAISQVGFKQGDVVYIKQITKPDRWFGGILMGNYIFYKMETSKIDISTKVDKLTSSDISSSYVGKPFVYTATRQSDGTIVQGKKGITEVLSSTTLGYLPTSDAVYGELLKKVDNDFLDTAKNLSVPVKKANYGELVGSNLIVKDEYNWMQMHHSDSTDSIPRAMEMGVLKDSTKYEGFIGFLNGSDFGDIKVEGSNVLLQADNNVKVNKTIIPFGSSTANVDIGTSSTPFGKVYGTKLYEGGVDISTKYLTGNQNISVTGDATGSGATAITLTLASILPNVDTTAGYSAFKVDTKGRVTAVGKSIEWGTSVGQTPSDDLMDGGLFMALQG